MVDKMKGDGGDSQSCELLIRNAYVITMDAERTKYPKGAVAVDGQNIVAVGSEIEIVQRFKPLRIIDAGVGQCIRGT